MHGSLLYAVLERGNCWRINILQGSVMTF